MTSSRNHASTLALLLDAGASINAHTDIGGTLLMLAVAGGATNCFRLLLARGGPVLELDTQTNVGKQTALHAAAFLATPEIVRMLLAAGADPMIRDHQCKHAPRLRSADSAEGGAGRG